MNVDEPRYTIRHVEIVDGGLTVHWDDGHNSRFHPVWLRHQCTCSECGTPVNAVRGIRIHHIPEDIQPTVWNEDQGQVSVCWSNDAHQSIYTAQWLRDHCPSDAERKHRKHQPVLWNAEQGAQVSVYDFEHAEKDPRVRLSMLRTVCDYGYCKIINAPGEASEASRLIGLVGQQRQSHYGTYTLSKKSAIDNVGDVTSALDPHTDETYRMSSIGITVFQVLRPGSGGGESTLVDGFEAARRLREQSPDDFDLLTQVPVITQRMDMARNSEGPGGETPRYFVSRRPMIKLDSDGSLSGVQFNERQISALDASPDIIGPCYSALRKIFNILYDPDLRLTFPLSAGEGLLFNNQRVLHGRTAFEPAQPARSVLTGSVDLEEFYSTLRMLESKLDGAIKPVSFSQGMAF